MSEEEASQLSGLKTVKIKDVLAKNHLLLTR
jgi:hypothetical protein